MPVDILLVILATSVVQSIFGVGVLLFGTPLLLLLGYGFIDVLAVLLPISICISCLQVIKHYDQIDMTFYKKVIVYCIPFIVLFLIIISTSKVNIGLYIGVFLLFVALENAVPFIDNALKSIVKFERIYLMFTGFIHGLSNLGGSLLTVIIYSKKYPKDKTRATSAACYATMALFQLATLLLVDYEYTVSFSDKITLMHVGVLNFLFIEEVLYKRIANEHYSKIFAAFLFASGIALILKSL